MDRLIKIIFLAAVISMIWNCSRKITPATTQDDSYYEDLSASRPGADEYKSPEPSIPAKSNTVISQPVIDVTDNVEIILDSMNEINRRTQFSRFTIQVHISNSRELADSARYAVYRVLPNEKPILEYSQPSYRVKVGRYLNHLEAYRTLLKLKEQFPNAIIVPESVYFK